METALILSGWSPGPLPTVVQALEARGLACEEVPLPMPPCGCYWLLNPFVLVLGGLVVGVVLACQALDDPLYCVAVVVAALAAARLAVAGLVLFSIARGVANANALAARRRVVLVVGFSWGGGVAHWLLAEQKKEIPALLLAPTSVAMAAACLVRHPPRIPHPPSVAVVTALYDDFCPPRTAGLYEAFGCRSVDRLQDDHVLSRADSLSRILGTVAALLDDDGA
ncbi:hypothetical protein CTAYLR_009156 [Chrysophaeum taylorii]|uniref:Uncharacterized protein n=1 Tax=Chrysophaeum taylorii TaxID=2483200 RepID=A0AAD7UIJ7_9STRA|nr:hypothetical protein CTAYLR_009156 [Chrysophaeum taylorii]